jgi:putative transposase
VRQARIKIKSTEGDAVYHCMSRTVNGEWLFDDLAKEILRRQLWQVADFCGVQILTYGILVNHFHVLVRVPAWEAVSDTELLRRYHVLYPTPTRYQAARLAVIEGDLARNGPEAAAWRKRQLALMGDVSSFMKLLKQRFSIWFNKTHHRFGTLWAERFKSVFVEATKGILQTLAAYIDLNSIRAGLVRDPKDYRFCGYAEAVAGNLDAQAGIASVVGGRTWTEAQACYRQVIFGTGAGPHESGTISLAQVERVMEEGGKLPLPTVLRCRIRYLTDGAVLGGRAFVEKQLVRYRQKTSYRRPTEPYALPKYADWGDMLIMRAIRRRTVG